MGRNIWSWVWIQRYNLKIPLLAHYTHYLSSFAALAQLHHPRFPSGLLLFSASLAANELRYRTACLLLYSFLTFTEGLEARFIHFFIYFSLIIWEWEAERGRWMTSSSMLMDWIVLVELLVAMKITSILLNLKIYLLLPSMNLLYSELYYVWSHDLRMIMKVNGTIRFQCLFWSWLVWRIMIHNFSACPFPHWHFSFS